jgi:chromosome segregation ATPase
MPQHDNEPLTDIPQMVPDRDELVSYQRQKQKNKPKESEEESGGETSSRSGNTLVYVVGLIALLAAGAAGYLFTQLQNAQERVAALEQRLSSTDESVNQSSGALQVKINEVNDALAQVRDETLKKYKAQIDQQAGQITALDKSIKGTQSTLSSTDKNIGEQTKLIEGLRGDINKLPGLVDQAKQRIDQQQSALDALSNKVKGVNDAQTKLDARLANNEEWVESINTFRKQMNREIVNIKQQIAGGKPTPPPADIQ